MTVTAFIDGVMINEVHNNETVTMLRESHSYDMSLRKQWIIPHERAEMFSNYKDPDQSYGLTSLDLPFKLHGY